MVNFEKLLIDLDAEVLFPIRVWIERYKTPLKIGGIVLPIAICGYIFHLCVEQLATIR